MKLGQLIWHIRSRNSRRHTCRLMKRLGATSLGSAGVYELYNRKVS